MPIDVNSFEPAHRQLARIIRTEINRGGLPPGALLPTQASLSRRFGVTRETARRAISLLSAEGLIVTIRAIGSFVQLPRAGKDLPAGLAKAGGRPGGGPRFGTPGARAQTLRSVIIKETLKC